MISRGEVALIVANKGSAINLLPKQFLGSIIAVVIFSTLITPILLKLAFKENIYFTHRAA